MFTVHEFIDRYEKYSDDDLITTFGEIKGYSPEAQEAFKIVIDKRGGEEHFVTMAIEKRKTADEIERLTNEATWLSHKNDITSVKRSITSDILSRNQVNEVIEDIFERKVFEEEDKKIKPRTIYGSIIGGSIGSVLGAALLAFLWDKYYTRS